MGIAIYNLIWALLPSISDLINMPFVCMDAYDFIGCMKEEFDGLKATYETDKYVWAIKDAIFRFKEEIAFKYGDVDMSYMKYVGMAIPFFLAEVAMVIVFFNVDWHLMNGKLIESFQHMHWNKVRGYIAADFDVFN